MLSAKRQLYEHQYMVVESESSFDGLVSTSNHLVPGQNVWIKTTKPIWWTVELRTIECRD
jgi:thiamine pyrophosphokinase